MRKLAREFIGLKPMEMLPRDLISNTAENAAQTKQELADIINVVIEELVKQRFELPSFTVLFRIACSARSIVDNQIYKNICSQLSEDKQNQLNNLLELRKDNKTSDWQRIKQEPKKPTNKEFRNCILHLIWLKDWVDRLPTVYHISSSKWRKLVIEARALNAAELKQTKPTKRFTLIVVLIHSQLCKAMDNMVNILIRRINSLHNKAKQRLQQYHLDHITKTEKLIGRFRDVIKAYRESNSNPEKNSKIDELLCNDSDQLETDCDEYMAYSGNNFIPFMLSLYRNQRAILLNCIMDPEIQTAS